MERYWVANGILASNECGGLVKYDDAQRALDAEREKAKQLDRTLADVYQQRDGLQAQLAQPIHICQRCGRVSRDGWVTARYECDELHGSLQCPDCQCIDLETNTAKELAALCSRAQAQLAAAQNEIDTATNQIPARMDGDSISVALIKLKDSERDITNQMVTLQAQLRQVEGERDDYRLMYMSLTGETYDNPLSKARGELTTLRQLVEAFVQHFDSDFENPGLELYGRVNGGEISNGGKGLNELLAKARATLAAQDVGINKTAAVVKDSFTTDVPQDAGKEVGNGNS